MEDWQINHINKNLSELIRTTIFNAVVRYELVTQNILSEAEVDNLEVHRIQNGTFDANLLCYELLMSKANSYKILTHALIETRQTGAAGILIRVPNALFDKPLTYLGISMGLDEFKNAEIEVNGITLKLQEFFQNVNYDRFQNIFQAFCTELEIYDRFVTNHYKFVLAKNTVPPKPPYYVPRCISNQIKLHESVFKADCPDVFVFKNMPRFQLAQIARPHFTDTSTSQLTGITSRFIYLDDDEDWTELKKIANVPIHLISYEADQNIFILEDTSTVSDILRKYVSQKERVYLSEIEFIQQQLKRDSKPSSICICDTPGMGKTFVLASIARRMIENFTGKIIAFIHLTTFTADFSTHLPSPILNVLQYVSPSNKNGELLLEMIKAELLGMEIFFDGFDEIPSDKVERMTQFFRSITTEFSNVKIYVSSRPHMRQKLEESLGVIAYDILPFSRQNQNDFLVQYWSRDDPTLDITRLQENASSILDDINKSLSRDDKEITGIPLLCMVFAESTQIPRNTGYEVTLRVSKMYQMFIERRMKLTTSNQEEMNNLLLTLYWHALKLIFPSDRFHEDTQFKKVNHLLMSSKIFQTGLLQQNSSSAPEFVHRTFAEYFVAEYIFSKLQSQEMETSGERKFDAKSIFKLLFKAHKTERKYDNDQALVTMYYCNYDYYFLHSVVLSFLDSGFFKDKITEDLKSQTAIFLASISPEEFITMLNACCQQNLRSIFYLLKEAMTKCDSRWIRQYFTTKSALEHLTVSIRGSSSQMFHNCIKIFTEVLDMDVTQMPLIYENSSMIQRAVKYGNYEAVEYFVNKSPIKNLNLLEECVQYSYHDSEIEKRENILQLLLDKEPSLIKECPGILLGYSMHSRLIEILIRYGANLTAAKHGINCAMRTAQYMSSIDFHEFVNFLLNDCKAEYLFLDNGEWVDPLPTIIERVTLLPETMELIFNIPGTNIGIKNRNQENLLFSAVLGNQFGNVKELLSRGLDRNARGSKNQTLLHVAAEHGDVIMIQHLLSLKLDPNSRDQDNETPLHRAIKRFSGKLSVAEILLKNGADARSKTVHAQTALHLYVKLPYCLLSSPEEVIKYLLEKGLKVNDRDIDGNTPLHLCMWKKVKEGLVEVGADIYARNRKGQTPV